MRKTSTILIILSCVLWSCSYENESNEEISNSVSPPKSQEKASNLKEPFTPDTLFEVDESIEKLDANIGYIVESINSKNLDISTFKILRKDAEFDKYIKIYSLNNLSNGTRALVTLPIIQWNNEGKLYAARLHEYTEATYDHIYRLNSQNNLYLLLGNAKGDGSCHFNYAYVIQIKNDEINLEYPAFGGRPYLNFCNGVFTFNEANQELNYRLIENTIESLDEIMFWYDHYGKFSEDTISARKIIDAVSPSYYKNH
jgi:hypothetical protein